MDVDADDSQSVSSRTSILSRSRRLDRRPLTPQKDASVDDIDKMKVAYFLILIIIRRRRIIIVTIPKHPEQTYGDCLLLSAL